ncbi:7b6ba02d-dcea-4c2b-a54e-7c0d4260f090 [Sclerotinia trifoliorum]|uniref:7b6ba02d-dcea-4c2b-a54e-7c0d4260f090 n=1 Tax=Sclerotinia trifoliorum TaxID=28548 RepID=A0A8H2W4G5_9HELO|nr:7b6ba02d-dcea-4c2b-a54e-7c0d4260f090 [Sclerotinia trifoliorum]
MYNPHQSNRNLSYSSTSQPFSSAYPLINAASSMFASTSDTSPRYTFSEQSSSKYTAAVQPRNPTSSTTTPLNNPPAPYIPQPRVYPKLIEHRRNFAHHNSSSRRNNESREDLCSEDTCFEDTCSEVSVSLPSSPDPSNGQATRTMYHPSLQNPIPIPGHVFPDPDSENPVLGVKEQKSLTSSRRNSLGFADYGSSNFTMITE